jgi:hypothetical protein
MGELVIHVFAPLSTNDPSACLRARVSMPAGSDPWFGSVSPKHPMRRAAASSGRYLREWRGEVVSAW